MKTETTETSPTPPAENDFSGRATYSPEDDKIRLYIGRVPRDEYLKLRADGWTALHKQREAGGGDFVATWTPSRRDTALEYAGIIEDEDMGPAERAADRAERFSGYRDKRTVDATGHADRYDAGPAAHGYQSQARAERAAARHDRIADRAGDAWSKAEYWTRRTAGVIGHALYKSSPGVRMGRIKTIEAEKRKLEASREKSASIYRDWQKIAAITPAEKQNEIAARYAGNSSSWFNPAHPVTGKEASLYTHLTDEQNPITGAQAAALYLAEYTDPASQRWGECSSAEWLNHYDLRLAYENQMLTAQGGRLEQCEVLPGGKLGGKLILKVSKSSVTKRATSCEIIGPKVSGWAYQVTNIPGTEWAAYKFDLERLSPDAYTPPTAESLAELATVKKQIKNAAPVKAVCPLINPTEADAERLQAVWNERAKAQHCAAHLKSYSRDYAESFVPATVCRITQAVYSQNSQGSYSRAETRGVRADAQRAPRPSNMYCGEQSKRDKEQGPAVCDVRITSEPNGKQFTPPRVIVLTDKPQKPLPAAVWEKYVPAKTVYDEREANLKSYAGKSGGLSYTVNA